MGMTTLLERRLYSVGECSIAPFSIPDEARAIKFSLDRTELPNTPAVLVTLKLEFWWAGEWGRDHLVESIAPNGEPVVLCFSGWRQYGIAGGQTRHARSSIELTPKNCGLPMTPGRSVRGRLIVHADCTTDLQVDV